MSMEAEFIKGKLDDAISYLKIARGYIEDGLDLHCPDCSETFISGMPGWKQIVEKNEHLKKENNLLHDTAHKTYAHANELQKEVDGLQEDLEKVTAENVRLSFEVKEIQEISDRI